MEDVVGTDPLLSGVLGTGCLLPGVEEARGASLSARSFPLILSVRV